MGGLSGIDDLENDQYNVSADILQTHHRDGNYVVDVFVLTEPEQQPSNRAGLHFSEIILPSFSGYMGYCVLMKGHGMMGSTKGRMLFRCRAVGTRRHTPPLVLSPSFPLCRLLFCKQSDHRLC